MNDKLKEYAKKTFLAQLNPMNSIVEIDMLAHSKLSHLSDQYLGIKNTEQIPLSFIQKLSLHGYIKHTIDSSSLGGRAIDLQIKNPITGKWMSGSSSGTAVNVFLGINDIGIGTDGGGSILAPAMCLNLFSFISNLIEQEHMVSFNKKSTDGIEFSPSIGYITRDFDTIKRIIEETIKITQKPKNWSVLDVKQDTGFDVYCAREKAIEFLQESLNNFDLVISVEGPVDIEGIGDSVFGHFDEHTRFIQKSARKGLIRIVNMINATALSIPTSNLGVATVLICESKPEKIAIMLDYAERFIQKNSALIEQYFLDLDKYFIKGYKG